MAGITIEQRMEHFCNKLLEAHENGNVNALDLAYFATSFIRVAKECTDTLKEYTKEHVTEISTLSHENGGYKGFRFSHGSKPTWSYKTNPKWVQLKAEMTELEKDLKATYEEALANPESLQQDKKGYFVIVEDIDETTGEVKKEFEVRLPTLTKSSFLKADKIK